MVEAGCLRGSGDSFGLGRILFFLCLVALVVGVSLHAVEKHGAEADAVYRCMEDRGPVQTWVRDDRYIHVCEVMPGVYGLVIESLDGNPITAFIRNKARVLEDVVRYLERQGAELVWSGR